MQTLVSSVLVPAASKRNLFMPKCSQKHCRPATDDLPFLGVNTEHRLGLGKCLHISNIQSSLLVFCTKFCFNRKGWLGDIPGGLRQLVLRDDWMESHTQVNLLKVLNFCSETWPLWRFRHWCHEETPGESDQLVFISLFILQEQIGFWNRLVDNMITFGEWERRFNEHH